MPGAAPRLRGELSFDYDGIVDKFVGDEVVGIFIPALAHDEHSARAIAAARSGYLGVIRRRASASARLAPSSPPTCALTDTVVLASTLPMACT